MIVTVTPNPALDVTYRVERLIVDATNRVAEVSSRAGGKGVNVARLLHGLSGRFALGGSTLSGRPEGGGNTPPGGFGQLEAAARGLEVVALGLTGGAAGAAFLADLDDVGLAHAFVRCEGETRRTVAIVDSGAGTVTMLNEAGPAVTPTEWKALCHRLEGVLPEASVLVLSGSLPPGLPPDAYATLVRQAERHGVPAILDADGTALRLAIPAGPEIVKPNAAELARALAAEGDAFGHVFGGPVRGGVSGGDVSNPASVVRGRGFADTNPVTPPGPIEGAAWMRREGARAVVVSDGPRGLYADTPGGRWRAVPPQVMGGNPTGAGDAAVAALTLGLASGWDWPQTLIQAAALSAAAVSHPVAGQIDSAAYLDQVDRVHLERAESESEGTPCR